jgi:dimethylamine monooxygenase subunit A
MTTADWCRLFPLHGHQWNMGLRRGDLNDYLRGHDSTGELCQERAHLLTTNTRRYAGVLPAGEVALRETATLAQSLGIPVANGDTTTEQLIALGSACEPDFAWLSPKEPNVHQLVGGVVCFPSSWALEDKLGKPMFEVHGPVPKLNDRFGRQIETFMAKQSPGEAWIRENVNFSRNSARNHHPAVTLKKLDATITPDEFWIRLERQLLTKLPVSGCILFGIRIEVYPLTDFLTNPELAPRLAHYLENTDPTIAAYKGLTTAIPQVIAWLHAAQK